MKKFNVTIYCLLVSAMAVEIYCSDCSNNAQLPAGVQGSMAQKIYGFLASRFGGRSTQTSPSDELSNQVSTSNSSFFSDVSQKSTSSYDLKRWQKEVQHQIANDALFSDFEWSVLKDGSMQVTGNFTVGKDTWRVYTINGKDHRETIKMNDAISRRQKSTIAGLHKQKIKEEDPEMLVALDAAIQEQAKPFNEAVIPWKSEIVILPTEKDGVFKVKVTTPNPHYFTTMNVRTTPLPGCSDLNLKSGGVYNCHNISNLSDFLQTKAVRALSPLMYSPE